MQVRGGIQALGRMQSTADIARNFSSVMAARRPVIDKTGLSGVYDYDVLYQPEFQGANVDYQATVFRPNGAPPLQKSPLTFCRPLGGFLGVPPRPRYRKFGKDG